MSSIPKFSKMTSASVKGKALGSLGSGLGKVSKLPTTTKGLHLKKFGKKR